MTNNKGLGKGLQKRCQGKHPHVQCRGELCKDSENYTTSLASRIHLLFGTIVVDGASRGAGIATG
eukprot:12900866-Prorocentrum_lima.AAC.1